MSGPLVICIGNRDRGDDGAGRLAARILRERRPDLALCELDGDAGALITAMAGRSAAYLIDAAAGRGPPGRVARYDACQTPLPPAVATLSSHGLGLVEAVEMARALGTLPPRCIVYAIEGRDFAQGAPMSPAVAAAAAEAVARLVAEMMAAGHG